MGRIRGTDGALIVQADITSIAYNVYDLDGATPHTATTTGTLTVADVVFDTLQTDERWSADGLGYNFRADVAASVPAHGGHTYLIDWNFTPASGEEFPVLGRFSVIPRMSG